MLIVFRVIVGMGEGIVFPSCKSSRESKVISIEPF